MPHKVRRKSNDSRYFEMLWVAIGTLLTLKLDAPWDIPFFLMGCVGLAWLYLDYIDDQNNYKRSVMMKDLANFRMFKYERGKEFSVTIVIDDGAIVAFTDSKLPANCDQDTSLAFFEEAEVAAEVYMMRESDNVKNKTH